MYSSQRIVQVVDYLVVYLRVKRALMKTVVHSEAFELTTCFEADGLVCVQVSPSKYGQAVQKFAKLALGAFYCVVLKSVWCEMASCSLHKHQTTSIPLHEWCIQVSDEHVMISTVIPKARVKPLLGMFVNLS